MGPTCGVGRAEYPHRLPVPKQSVLKDRHAGRAVQSVVASPSWQAQQPVGRCGGDARATATQSAGGPLPLGSGRRRASSRWACPAFGPAERATGYSRASPRCGTDARRCFLRKDARSLVWGPDRGYGNVRLGPATHHAVSSVGDFTLSSPSIKRREARRRVNNVARPRSSADPAREKFASAGCPQDFHDASTAFPQLGSVRFTGSAPEPAM